MGALGGLAGLLRSCWWNLAGQQNPLDENLNRGGEREGREYWRDGGTPDQWAGPPNNAWRMKTGGMGMQAS